jgi:hypothetical protein
MSTQFVPDQFFVHGPNVPNLAPLTANGATLTLRHGPVPVVIFRGKVPFRKEVRFTERNDAELKITPSRFGRAVAFEFCGTAVNPTVDAAVPGGDLEEVSRHLNDLLNTYIMDAFTVV